MFRRGVAFASALLLPMVASACGSVTQPTPEDPTLVQVEGGTVRGAVADGLFVYKGIPFAAPPVGELRWRAPQPAKPWDGVLEASDFSPDPMQPVDAGSLAPARTSEDCLYLNIWRPAAKAVEPLPVMVWIYGGGLVRGGASTYPGTGLARQNLVVVTFNYRVGRLGFFAHPALAREAPDDLRGNYGYMDQLAALQWVQRNIAAFGGDPSHVTIAGESAGGGSVLVLLTSRLARGLFQRAILQSPGIPTARAGATPMRPLAAAESIAVEYARAAGIEGDDEGALAALRAIPAATLCAGLDDYVLSIVGGPEIPGLSHSILDGRLVVEPPEATLRAGRQAPVPVLAGANDADFAASPAQTKAGLFAAFGALEAQARKLYDPYGNTSLSALIQTVTSDELMVEPTRNLAQLVTRDAQTAWFYRFSYVAESQRGKVAGALHAAEIAYAFDLPAALLGDQATPGDIAMGNTMSAYWTAFVRTGDPNGADRPAWPRYDTASNQVLNFTNDGVLVGPDPLQARLDLWQAVWDGSP